LLDDVSYVSENVEFKLIDERITPVKADEEKDIKEVLNTWTFFRTEGMKDLAKSLVGDEELIGFNETIRFQGMASHNDDGNIVSIGNSSKPAFDGENFVSEDCSIGYIETLGKESVAIANGIRNPHGGTHITGARQALQEIFND